MEQKIRKGNTFHAEWEVLVESNGEQIPYDLSNRHLKLYVACAPYWKVEAKEFSTEGNILRWTFEGKDQRHVGPHTLTLVENEGRDNMRTVDVCNAFELVNCSHEEGGEGTIKIETVHLSSVFGYTQRVDQELDKTSPHAIANKVVASEFEKVALEVKRIEDEIVAFNSEGYYPDLTVGMSDNLVGRGESVPAEFSFRASGGKSIKDGSARIKRLKGNSVVWNQWAKPFEEAYEKPYHDEGITYNGNKVTIDNWRSYLPFRFDIKCSTAKDHLYLVLLNYANTNPDQLIYIEFGGENSFPKKIGNIECFHRNIIYNNDYKDTITLYLAETLEGTVTLSDLQVIDLTKMFGAGNEPTTIEEYEARKPIVADEFAYNEGEVIHMTAEGIKSVGDNAWDEEWENGGIDPTNGNLYGGTDHFRNKGYMRILPNTQYYFKKPIGVVTYLMFYDEDKNFVKWLDPFATTGNGGVFTTYNAPYMRFVCYMPTYNHDITISLYHSGWKAEDAKYQPYWEDRLMFDKRIKDEFPDGMSKWDMVYNKNGKGYIVKGMSIIDDLSLYDWQYLDDDGRFFVDGISGLTSVDITEMSELLCAKYVALSALDTYLGEDGIANDNDRLWIKDNSTTEVTVIKDKLHNVRLYHRLAEPTIIEYDEPFNLDYEVADFGTEEIIASKPSAPLSADIIYQFNAVDMIRENYNEIQQLKTMLVTLQAQLTSLTNK